MKPLQRQAELRRKVARWARKIPDNAAYMNLLLSIPELPKRRDFYFSTREFLRFVPVRLEDLNAE